jgi:hypothetical protein
MSNGWSPPQPLRHVVVVGCRDLRNLVHCLLLSLLEGSGPAPDFNVTPNMSQQYEGFNKPNGQKYALGPWVKMINSPKWIKKDGV